MERSHRIHWLTPANIFFPFLSAVALAIGHHCFYQHLAGQSAPSGSYEFGRTSLSKQQANIAAGTAFAFLFRATLTFAVATSYTQLFWRMLKTSRKPTRVSEVDGVFSSLSDLTSLFRFSTWRRRYALLGPIAVIFWLLPVASVFSPATLSVRFQRILPNPSAQTSVPQFDFVNPNWFTKTSGAGNEFSYTGPSVLTQRVAAAAAAQGEILPIAPPGLNASWSYSFSGPSLHCDHLQGPNRTEILDNIADFTGGYNYLAWTSRGRVRNGTMPYTNISGTSVEFPGFDVNRYGISELFISVTSANPLFNSEYRANLFDDATLISCGLQNASYALDFQYVDGEQQISIEKSEPSPDKLINRQMEFFFPVHPLPDGTVPTFNCAADEVESPRCFNEEAPKKASYQAIEDAFGKLLSGLIVPVHGSGSTSPVLQTVLAETDELLPVVSARDNNTGILDSPNFVGRAESLATSRGPLIETIEQLFENITISMLSEPLLQPDWSSEAASSPLVDVTFDEYGNIYEYHATTLWIAYGIAIFFAALAVLTGSTAMWLSGVAYDSNFSTVLRTSYISEAADGDSVHLPHDDGSRPLPKALARSVIVVNDARMRRSDTEIEEIDVEPDKSEPSHNVAKGYSRAGTPEMDSSVPLKRRD